MISHARNYVENCLQPLADKAIGNLHGCKAELLQMDGTDLPITITTRSLATATYTASPYNTYIRYAAYEINRLKNPVLRISLHALLLPLRLWISADQLDSCVTLNNWLTSTNLYPTKVTGTSVPEVTAQLVQQHPAKAIIFRSLTRRLNSRLLHNLEKADYVLLASRQVYICDLRTTVAATTLKRRDVKADLKLLQQSHYSIRSGATLDANGFQRAAELYSCLYLEKYCPLNPVLTANWLQRGVKDGWLDLYALYTPEGRMDAVAGWYQQDDCMVAPVFGYDTSLPPQLGLYRMLSALGVKLATEKGCLLHLSSGAAEFKHLRGGTPCIEYMAVYISHLHWRTRLSWCVMQFVFNRIGIPLLQRMKL